MDAGHRDADRDVAHVNAIGSVRTGVYVCVCAHTNGGHSLAPVCVESKPWLTTRVVSCRVRTRSAYAFCVCAVVYPFYMSYLTEPAPAQPLPPAPAQANYSIAPDTWGQVWTYRRSVAVA